MRQCFCILVAVFTVSTSLAGVGPVQRTSLSGPVKPEESAAVFVGVREFPDDASIAEVKYAVDDAVDLAYVLSSDPQTRLVDPKRVVLALSGNPQKNASKDRLKLLENAGALVRDPTLTEIIKLLESQAKSVGKNGILIVAFATHGISEEGTQYLLTSTSLLKHRTTSVSETMVRDIVSQWRVPRSLILLDACRQRLTRDARTGDADPRSVAGLMRAMAAIHGQVVFSAATAGQYAYDDDTRRNGVFTAAVIEGLQCRARVNKQGFVTVDSLHAYVEEQVLSWVRRNKDPQARTATNLQSEGRSRDMPLAICPAQ